MTPGKSLGSAAPVFLAPGRGASYTVLQKSSQTEANNPLRSIAFSFALCLIFIKFGMVQEIQAQVMGFNAKLLYVFGVPALVGVLLTGGFARALSVRTGIYWALFAFWLCLGTPFSTWRGGSVPFLIDFLRTDLIMLFVIGGLVTSWDECKKVIAVIGLAGILNVISGRIFAGQMSDRYALDFGTVSNPNDYAAHLVLVLPFVLYLALSRRMTLVRVAAALALCGGIYFTLKTASRGAEVALVVDAFIFLLAGNMRRRVAVICLAPTAAVALVAFLPGDVLVRLRSFSSSDSTASVEALESSESRDYVLRKSIQYAFEFPIFGVGMDQFAQYEGGHNILIGTHGYWHGTHNSFTEAASEGGLPAGLLLIASWVSGFLVVRKINKRARARSDCADIELATFYIMVAIAGFVVAITFLNFAYLFYGPAIGGLVVALKRAVDAEFLKRDAVARPIALQAPPYSFQTR